MAYSICIISQQHLSRNPRVLKEAIALEKMGYKVTILTSVYNKGLLAEDYKLLKDKKINYIFYNNLFKKNISSYISRGFFKVGRWFNRVGIENKWALGYAPNMCRKMAVQQKADLYICHQELPSYIGTLLMQIGKKTAFDIEDWYTNDLLPQDQKYRAKKLLTNVEKIALTLGHLVYTTSEPMAREMGKKYKAKDPEIIYNCFNFFSSELINSELQKKQIKLIWLSQTIGRGRGIEEIIETIDKISLQSFELNLRGDITEEYKFFLISLLKNKVHQINFLPLIPNGDIQKDLQKYDIGLALELSEPLSRNLTLTNKIFHYFSVGLPVIASGTQGQLSLKNDFKSYIWHFHNKQELTQIFNNLDKNQLQKRKEIINIYRSKYDWSLQETKLQGLIKDVLT